MERRKRSKVWLHFTKRDENAAVCNQCNAAISCKGANTSNMLKHLSTRGGRYTGIIVITGVTLRHDMLCHPALFVILYVLYMLGWVRLHFAGTCD